MFNKKSISYVATVLILMSVLVQAHEHEEKGHSHGPNEHHEDNFVKLSKEQIEKLGIKIKTAGPGTLHLTLSTRGKIIVHPDKLAHIIPKVSGVAKEAYKNIGNYVKMNDVMAVLESKDIADVKAAYLSALSKFRVAGSSFEREERLFQEKISPAQDYHNAKNIFEEAEINLHLARQKLLAFGLTLDEIYNLTEQSVPDLSLYQIRTPIDGIVIMRHITKGEFIDNTATIYEVADLSTVWVEIGIYPKDLYKVKEGQIVEVVIPVENKSAQARLIFVSPIIADETITAKAVAELDNPQGFWKPGVFVKVNIATEKISLPLVIPKEAVQTSEGKDFVFIETHEGFEKHLVKLGMNDHENTEVLSGLNPGEKYAANNTFLLKAELEKSTAEHEH